jgi:hypothetical protein
MDKMDWTKILTDLGLAGIIAYSIKTLIESFFQKSVKYYEKQLELKQETHRLEISKSLEAYKTELNLFNQKISDLNSKRLEILAMLYEYIADADMRMRIMTARIKAVMRWSSLAGQLFCQIFQTDIIQNGGWSIHPLVVNQSVIGGDRKVI